MARWVEIEEIEETAETIETTEEPAEKGLRSLRTPADHFAYWLSQLASLFVVGLGVLGYVALSTVSTRTTDVE